MGSLAGGFPGRKASNLGELQVGAMHHDHHADATRLSGKEAAILKSQTVISRPAEVVTNCDHLGRLKFSMALPWAFTEHGAIMTAKDPHLFNFRSSVEGWKPQRGLPAIANAAYSEILWAAPVDTVRDGPLRGL
jgi:hypothetical protein